MLLDVGSVLGGIGLAVVGFIVVILVCVVILRLLAAILPSYEDRDRRPAEAGTGSEAVPGAPTDPEAPAPAETSTQAAMDPDRAE